MIWSVLVLPFMVAQHWWASFGPADHADWSFGSFAMTALIYMMTAIVLPDIPADQEVDLRDIIFARHRPFFGLAIAVVGWSLLREYMLEGQWLESTTCSFMQPLVDWPCLRS